MALWSEVTGTSPKSSIPNGSPSAGFTFSFHAEFLAVYLGVKIVHVPFTATIRELQAFLVKWVIIPARKRSTARPCDW